MRSWAYFDGPIRHALHQLKYNRDIGLGDTLALSFESFIRNLGWTADMLIPVPLGSERMKERGYNQVGLIARPLARAFNWQYKPHGLKRKRETKSQVGLTILERQENVRGAFRAEPAIVSGARVLLMDDVATTGATLSECARALLNAGAKAVSAVTIAHALWSDRTVE
jgi:ComF family protein